MAESTKTDHLGVVVLIRPEALASRCPAARAIGEVFDELSYLYQLARERTLDIVLVDSRRNDLTRGVAAKLRRHSGLTEIWLLTDDETAANPNPEYIDGVLPCSLDHESFRARVDHILWTRRLLREYGIVGRSSRMKMVAEMVHRVAPTDMSVLVVGPSGSGKELVAQAIHDHSQRRDNPQVAINCGALAEGVLESELFGHEKGAFTGSVGKREGLFSKAEGGTIFLDEIGETTQQMQVKLLRVLEDGTFYPVGSSQPRRADVRLISATNRDLTEEIAEGRFRDDLYFRIAVVKIIVPPLLERKQDIEPLLQFFWRHKPDLTYSDAALRRLMDYDWPGNIRQLRNFADRMAALVGKGMVETGDVDQFLEEQQRTSKHLPISTGRTVEEAGQELIYRAIMQLGQEVKMLRDLIMSHLPDENGRMTPSEEPRRDEASRDESPRTIEEMEGEMIMNALKRNNGNRKEAARQLGIGERTLYRKLKKYGLT